jgi:hypothetical protein
MGVCSLYRVKLLVCYVALLRINLFINVRFEVIKAVNTMTAFWDVTPCNLLDITEVLAERPASIFRTVKYDNIRKEYG